MVCKCNIKSTEEVLLELNLPEETNGPCANYRIGDDDLQAYDFIRQFRLDLMEKQYPGVSRVRGSNQMQLAYRLEKGADLTVPTRWEPYVWHIRCRTENRKNYL